jgi:hypothetical protein
VRDGPGMPGFEGSIRHPVRVLRRCLARLLAALAATVVVVVLLAGCHLDATADVEIAADGSGTITVTAVADHDVVAQAPGLAADLRFDDAKAAGWTVDGPAATADGGLRVALSHPVTSPAEATNLLNSLGPPFSGMKVERTASADGTDVTTSLTGQLTLQGGFGAFADSDLVAAAGGTPYAAQLQAAGATPATAMKVALRARLPGDVVETNGHEDGGARAWEAPLDGTSQPVLLRTRQVPGGGGTSSVLATVLLVLLVVWVVAAVAFILSVGRARARRARRRRRALSRLR